MRQLKPTGTLPERPGEGPFDVPKKFALEQLSGDATAFTLIRGRSRRRPARMDRPGDQLFPVPFRRG